MKSNLNLIKAMMLALLVLIVAGRAHAQKAKGVETIVIKTNIYCDHCKQCESCGGKLEEELYGAEGIKLISLDEVAMTLTINYNRKKTDPSKIKQAISNLGYDADDVPANAQAYEQLDFCCKKH